MARQQNLIIENHLTNLIEAAKKDPDGHEAAAVSRIFESNEVPANVKQAIQVYREVEKRGKEDRDRLQFALKVPQDRALLATALEPMIRSDSPLEPLGEAELLRTLNHAITLDNDGWLSTLAANERFHFGTPTSVYRYHKDGGRDRAGD